MSKENSEQLNEEVRVLRHLLSVATQYLIKTLAESEMAQLTDDYRGELEQVLQFIRSYEQIPFEEEEQAFEEEGGSK